MTGVSYSSARVFIALLARGMRLLRDPATLRGRQPALHAAVVAMPNRDMVARHDVEIPARIRARRLTFGFRWLGPRYRDAAFAFGFRRWRFLQDQRDRCVVAWPFGLRCVAGGTCSRRRCSCPLLFVAVVAGWSIFFIPFARYETQSSIASAHGAAPLPDANLLVYLYGLPAMTGWSLLVVSVLGLGVALHVPEWRRSAAMWLAWFGGCLVFLLMLPLHYEARYLTFALPAVAALAAMLFFARSRSRVPEWIA
jgi:hypothetical protein